jgi:DNA adenine methylase
LYRNYYEHDDHLAIAKTLKAKSFNRRWVVSYDNTVEIREMYELVNAKTYGLNYTAQRRYMGNEIMFFSSEIVVPDELSRVFCDAA